MPVLTKVLRLLLLALLAGTVAAGALLYVVGLDLANELPELAHLRLPVSVAVLVGLVPVVLGIAQVFPLLDLVDRGEAFSLEAVRLLRRIELLVGATGAYLAIGAAGCWVALLPEQSPSVPLGGAAAELAAMTALAVVAVLRRLAASGAELRAPL